MNVRSLFIDKLIDPSKHQLGIVRCNSKLEKMIFPTNVPSNNTVDGNYCIASYILFRNSNNPRAANTYKEELHHQTPVY